MKKIIVVTGASSGIGKEFLLQIEGKEKVDEIWAIARSKDKLEALQELVQTKIVPLSLDLSKREDLKVYQEKLQEEEVEISILANCAGYGLFQHTENFNPDDLANMVDLNCTSYIYTISYSLPYMKEGSKIMNIASIAGFLPIPYINCYAATKAFMLSYTRSLHMELRYRKIHVLAVTPLWTKTGFFDRAVNKEEKKVVIKYHAMYDPKKVVAKAIKDLYKKNKIVSCYGFINNLVRISTKFLPTRLIMKVWMSQEKLDGTPQLRK